MHTLDGHHKTVFGVRINNSGKRIISCSDDFSIKAWFFDKKGSKEVWLLKWTSAEGHNPL